MAHPRKKDGYIQLSHELAKAIALANFSKWATVLLFEIITQLYNLDRDDAQVNLQDLAVRHGADTGNIRSGAIELQNAGAIEKTGPQTYRFDKDYESWNRSGQPRMTQAEVAEAKRTPRRVAESLKTDAPNRVQKDAQTASKRTHPAKADRVQKDAQTASKRTHIETPSPAYKTGGPAPAELKRDKRDKEERDLLREEEIENVTQERPEAWPNTAEEITATFALADELYPWSSYPALAKRLCQTTRAVWVQDALVAASRGGKTPKTWSYITAIVDGYRTEGSSPTERSARIQPQDGQDGKAPRTPPGRFESFAERDTKTHAGRRETEAQAIREAITSRRRETTE